VGDLRPGQITKKSAKAWYKKLRKATPAKANAVIRFLRLWLNWCVDEEVLEKNVVAKPRLIGIPGRTRVWTDEELRLFCAKADEVGRASMMLAVLLAANLGQREGDILALSRAAYLNKGFQIRQHKTGVLI